MNEIPRPNQKRATNAVLFLRCLIVTHIIVALSCFYEYYLLTRITVGSGTEFNAELNAAIMIGTAFINFVAGIIAAVFFLRWFRRAYYNLQLLNIELRHNEWWTIVVWFIPVLCWIQPYRIMREIGDSMVSVLNNNSEKQYAYNRARINSWWVLWVLTDIAGIASFVMTYNAGDIDTVMNLDILDFFISSLSALNITLLIKIIKEYSSLEKILASKPDTTDAH